jgi:NADH-quinone oxidoreductase subunit A
MPQYTWTYTFLGIFFLLATVFAALPVVASKVIRPRKPSKIKQDPYECGMEKVGDAWIQFKIQYYLYALVFIVFDVEIVLIFPWAVVFKQLGPIAFIEMALFLAILFVGLVYVWKKRDLEWY